MTLTVSTDLTYINVCDAYASPPWYAIGAQTPATEPDFYVQGSGCLSRAVSGAGTEKGMWCDIGAGSELNFSAGGAAENMLIYIWMKCNSPQLIETMANGGMKIWLGTTTTNYATFTVGGSDYGIPDSDGWICYIIDPSLTPTSSGGSGLTLSSIRYFGGTIKTTTTAKGQNFGIDRISYGRGEIRCYGTSTSGLGFKDLADWDWTTDRTQRWGLMQVKNGIIACRCKIVIGSTGTSATTFTSNNETLVWECPMYLLAGNRVKAVPDEDEDGLGYWGINVQGNGTGATNVSFGTVVGSDAGRSGCSFTAARNDSLSTPARQSCRFITQTNITSLNMYGSQFRNWERTSPANAIDLTNVPSANDCFSNVFDGCGRIYFGTAEVKNCTILNSVADTDDGAVKWDSSTNLSYCSFINNTHAVVFESTTGTPFSFSNIKFSPTALGVRNESGGSISIGISGGDEPTAENTSGSETAFTSSVPFSLSNVVSGTEFYMDARTGGAMTEGDVILGPLTITTDPYTTTVPGNQPFKIRLCNASGTPKYEPMFFDDTTGSGFSRRIEQQLDE